MSAICRCLKLWALPKITASCLVLVLFTASLLLAQNHSRSQSLSIALEALCRGKRVQDGATISGPATLYLFPHLETAITPHAGDAVNIDFFADEYKLCSEKAVWQNERHPAHRPGQAVPLWIAPAQWRISDCIWSNAPAGAHTLTAQAFGLSGLSVTSAPIHFTITAP